MHTQKIHTFRVKKQKLEEDQVVREGERGRESRAMGSRRERTGMERNT